jgi:hypothetical protein
MVTRFLDRLEAASLITRKRNLRDKRLSIIKPTGKGKRLAQDLALAFDEVRRELFAGAAESDIRMLGSFFRKLHENAERVGLKAKGDAARTRIGRRKRGRSVLQTNQSQSAELSESTL